MLVGLVLILFNIPKYQVGTYTDDSYYITLARSLIVSERFGLINFPGDPLPGGFPVGLPLLLAPLVSVFPNSLVALKLLAVVATLTNASLIFWGWRLLSRGLSYWWGVAVASMFLLAVVTIDLSGMVMSEPAFLAFSLTAILLAEQLIAGRPLSGWPLWMGISLFFTLFVRTVGITFFAAIIIYLLVAGRRAVFKPLLLALFSLALVAVLVVSLTPIDLADLVPARYLRSLPTDLVGAAFDPPIQPQTEPSSEDGQNAGFLRNYIVGGMQDLLANKLRNAVLPVSLSGRGQQWADAAGLPFLPALLGYAVSGVLLLGAVNWLRRDGVTAFMLAGAVYLTGLFVWVWQEPRFLYPILPQLLLALLLGIYAVVNLTARLAGRLVRGDLNKPAGYAFAFLIGGMALLSVYRSANISPSYMHVGLLAERTAWLREHALLEEHLASESPTIDYLYSGLQTVKYDFSSTTPDDFLDYLVKYNVEYLLVAPPIKWGTPLYVREYSEDMQQILPFVDELESTGSFQLVFSGPPETRIRIYRVLR